MLMSRVIVAQGVDTEMPQILVNLAQRDGGGQIEIIQPQQIENLLKMQIANNRQQNSIPGFRINIFSQSGQTAQQRANETRVEFMRRFPDTNAIIRYNAPNFQVFVGDFRTRNEVLRELKKIQRIYPSAFLVTDDIQISK